MTADLVIEIIYQALITTVKVAGPMLLAGLVVGLLVGIFQAVTSVHEMTLTFIPKILAVAVTLMIFLPWMIRTLVGFTLSIYSQLPSLVN